MGSHAPLADLMIISPNRRSFLIDVKGLYRVNPWLVKRKPPRDDLYYGLAYVPPEASNRFFIITQAQANAFIEDELSRLGRSDNYPVTGFGWRLAEPYENAWHLLPK